MTVDAAVRFYTERLDFEQPLDLDPGGKPYAGAVGTDGLLIGEVAARSGVSRKALRLYESAGILPVPRRTVAGYRVYGGEAVAVLAFVSQARRLGFRLDEIREIVAIKRAGGIPCPHVRELVRRKTEEVERQIAELGAVRVRLGEAGNLVVLHKEEWNVLVDLIHSGHLSKL